MIFEPGVAYPQDRIGRYVYLDGTITAVDAFLPDLASIIYASVVMSGR